MTGSSISSASIALMTLTGNTPGRRGLGVSNNDVVADNRVSESSVINDVRQELVISRSTTSVTTEGMTLNIYKAPIGAADAGNYFFSMTTSAGVSETGLEMTEQQVHEVMANGDKYAGGAVIEPDGNVISLYSILKQAADVFGASAQVDSNGHLNASAIAAINILSGRLGNGTITVAKTELMNIQSVAERSRSSLT